MNSLRLKPSPTSQFAKGNSKFTIEAEIKECDIDRFGLDESLEGRTLSLTPQGWEAITEVNKNTIVARLKKSEKNSKITMRMVAGLDELPKQKGCSRKVKAMSEKRREGVVNDALRAWV